MAAGQHNSDCICRRAPEQICIIVLQPAYGLRRLKAIDATLRYVSWAFFAATGEQWTVAGGGANQWRIANFGALQYAHTNAMGSPRSNSDRVGFPNHSLSAFLLSILGLRRE